MRNVLATLIWIILTNQIIFSQNWLPIEMGNHWQFLRTKWSGLSFPNGTVTYELKEIVITKDTIINQERYFIKDAELIRYSILDKKAYTWWNGEERVYMDFNKTLGDTFHNGSAVYTITEGSKIIFLDTLEFKGFKRSYYIQPNSTNIKVEARFIPGIGWYSFHNSASNVFFFDIQTDELLVGILLDSIGNVTHLTAHYKPQITFTPVLITNNRLLTLKPFVTHSYNIVPVSNSSGFAFISSVAIERFYMKDDSVITIAPIQATGNPTGLYTFNTILDTSLMKNGFDFNYRFIAVDKGIIPETSYSPDSGYYKCVWDFSTDVENDDEFTIKEFSLSQNYPNPFNPSTKISWQSPVGRWTTLKIFNTLGEEIETLVNEEKSVGTYEVNWNAVNLPSGVYFYRLQVVDPETSSGQGFVQTRKMILLK